MSTPKIDLTELRKRLDRAKSDGVLGSVFSQSECEALLNQAEAAMDGEHVADSLAEKLLAQLREAEAKLAEIHEWVSTAPKPVST